jgi:dTDP-4-amino-4,6-dideoxygalactose transaminase
VFCDVEAETMNASARTVRDALRRARAAGLRVRAVVPVHLFGLCTPMTELAALAKSDGLALVEDAAQALGARDDAGRSAGGAGDAGCISFFPTKNLGAWGDGGAMVTSRDDVAARLRRLRAHGAVAPYRHAELGRNSRLDALQAAVLLAKTRHLPRWQASRARLASRYATELARLPLVLPHVPPAPAAPAWHAYVVRTPRRDALGAFLRDAGVETRVYYPVPLHRQECFRALEEPALPVTEAICATALALPLFPAMKDEQQGHVLEQVTRFLA